MTLAHSIGQVVERPLSGFLVYPYGRETLHHVIPAGQYYARGEHLDQRRRVSPDPDLFQGYRQASVGQDIDVDRVVSRSVNSSGAANGLDQFTFAKSASGGLQQSDPGARRR